jgi:hypothetical protein
MLRGLYKAIKTVGKEPILVQPQENLTPVISLNQNNAS